MKESVLGFLEYLCLLFLIHLLSKDFLGFEMAEISPQFSRGNIRGEEYISVFGGTLSSVLASELTYRFF